MSKASAAPVTLPDALATILKGYRVVWTANPEVAEKQRRDAKLWNLLQFSGLDQKPGVAELADALDSKSSGT